MNVGKTDLYLNGLNLLDTFSFLMQLSDNTLTLIYSALSKDFEQYSVDDSMFQAINWHLVTVRELLRCNRDVEVI